MSGTIKCAAGYSLGLKLKHAFKICFNLYNFDLFHSWDNRKVNMFLKILKNCKPLKEITEWLNKEYAADICVLKNIDWLDDKLIVNNSTIHQDLKHIMNSSPMVSLQYTQKY